MENSTFLNLSTIAYNLTKPTTTITDAEVYAKICNALDWRLFLLWATAIFIVFAKNFLRYRIQKYKVTDKLTIKFYEAFDEIADIIVVALSAFNIMILLYGILK